MPPTLARQLANAARDLQEAAGAQGTMDRVVALALDLVPHAEHAGISLSHRHRPIDTPAATSDVVKRVDALQYDLGEGPCLDALHHEPSVYSPDISIDERWPAWGPRTAEEIGIRSMMCFQLFTYENTLGALNLYASRTGSFDEADQEQGLALAAHAAVAVAAAQEIEGLTRALDSRSVIGQAMGILMERFQLGADPAFQVLARVSSHSNRRIVDIASELVETRRDPTTS